MRQLDDVGAVLWEHEAAQAFLEAQFGEKSFALLFVDRDTDRERARVWAGEVAATELCERAGMPALVQNVGGENYESIADSIRTVSGLDRESEPYHGEYPLTEVAADRFADVAAWSRTRVPTDAR